MRRQDPLFDWLLAGDPAIRWQAMQDLAGLRAAQVLEEKSRLARCGWSGRLLALQARDGCWGGGLYSPKWTSTTYTLLLLRWMGLAAGSAAAMAGTLRLLDAGLYRDGGINLWLPRRKSSETCVTGMLLALAARFAPRDPRRERLLDYLLAEQMSDGGWNCLRALGARHSSLHTTINVLEALLEYEAAAGPRAAESRAARARAHQFLFRHAMFRSHRTGKVIDVRMTRFSFPPQWHYDILRGLDYLRAANAPRDPRVGGAIDLLERRRAPEGTWPLQNVHPGRYHFAMEAPRRPSRWNTLRALRVLRWWEAPPSRPPLRAPAILSPGR